MKNTGRVVSLILLLAALFCLASCGEDAQPQDDTPSAADIDLTKMNMQIRYAYLCDILNNPEEYMGKRIRVAGVYQNGYDEDMQDYFHICLVYYDATQCCGLNVEFIKGKDTPDYPERGTDIEIEGSLGKYNVADETFYYIAADRFKVN